MVKYNISLYKDYLKIVIVSIISLFFLYYSTNPNLLFAEDQESEESVLPSNTSDKESSKPEEYVYVIGDRLNQQISQAYSFLEDFKINLDSPDDGKDTQINPDNYVAMYVDNDVIIIKLFSEETPNTVSAFRKLVHDGFYNNLIFYHVIPNYIIQAGDPTNSGYGGYGKPREAEISDKIKFERGSVAIANLGNLYSDDSQIFVTYNNFEWLDGKYTIFGKIVSGMSVFESYVPKFTKDGLLINPIVIQKMVLLSDLPKFKENNTNKNSSIVKTNTDKLNDDQLINDTKETSSE